MNGVSMNSNTGEDEGDYLDRLSRVLPLHQPFTSNERIIIVFFVAIFVSIVGCILFCLVCSQSPLRRRYYSKKKQDKEQAILVASAARQDFVLYPLPPSYESIVRIDQAITSNNSDQNRYFELGRQQSHGAASDSDVTKPNSNVEHSSSIKRKSLRSRSARSSLSNGGMTTSGTVGPCPPFSQIHVELNFDTAKNLLIIHLTNAQYVFSHPVFDGQAEFFIHAQLLSNKTLKKFLSIQKKRGATLPLSTWKNQQEKTTKKLSRASNDTLTCDEYLQFELNKDDVTSTLLRLILFCSDRTGLQDAMFEAVLSLNSSMISNYQQTIEFKDLPQVTFGEIFLGISYLPTAERLTIKLDKLRCICKAEKDQKIDARLIATFFHHGRRFDQQKLPSMIFDGSTVTTDNAYEIKETLIQNIPQNDIQSIYVHFELILRLFNSKDESIMSCGTFLLGEYTRNESNWQKMLEQPRQTHSGWYQFYG